MVPLKHATPDIISAHLPNVSLSDPKPDLLEHVPRLELWPDLGIDGSFAGVNICFSSLDKRRAPEDLPETVEEEVDGYDDVAVQGGQCLLFGSGSRNICTYPETKPSVLQLPVVNTGQALVIMITKNQISVTHVAHG